MSSLDKTKSIYVCQSCGHRSFRWLGKCPECGTWNGLVEEKLRSSKNRGSQLKGKVDVTPIPLNQVEGEEEELTSIGIKEFDRVLGGGLVKESVSLVGGDPGIGKSTLLLQVAEKVARNFGKVLYITGEESLRQLKLRADRLGVGSDNIEILTQTNLFQILEVLKQTSPFLVIVDSIQTTYSDILESPPGSISQIRECASQFIDFAKKGGCSFFLVGHVTKDGSLAGPKVLEHMVDTVLYFEGEKNHAYRILRTVKNRFGPTNEIGVFQMQQKGLVEVENPSLLFLSEKKEDISGSVVVCSLEGTRPILLELQALISVSNYGMPQRVSTGIDQKRLSLLLAILEKKQGLSMSTRDVFVNIAGGVKVDEPAVDLGTLVAIVSSFKDIPADSNSAVIGEVGLGGEVRGVSHIEQRIKESEKLGFTRCVVPQGNLENLHEKFNIEINGVKNIKQAFNLMLSE